MREPRRRWLSAPPASPSTARRTFTPIQRRPRRLRYYYALENTAATETAQKDSGLLNPGFKNKVTAFQMNPFVKFRARFVADQPAVVLSVLTDYEQIPRFMPIVRERPTEWAVVEQEATSGLMMLSKRVHLVLEIQERPDALRFRDRCGRSFTRYEGAWRLSEQNGQTVIDYELTAKPSLDVPGWMLKRVVRRDSAEVIGRLQREIAGRAVPLPPQASR